MTPFFIDCSGKESTFREWLQARYQYSPEYLRILCLATGWHSDYYKVMDWYRLRYQKEMALRRSVLSGNPFEQL